MRLKNPAIVLFMFYLLLTSMHTHAAPPAKTRLLGKIATNQYIAPEAIFTANLPFEKYDPAKHLVRDILFSDTLNVIFEDIEQNVRYHVEMSDLGNPGLLEERIADRVSTYTALIRRTYDHGLQPIYETIQPGKSHVFYFHQGEQPTRYHLFYFSTLGKRMVMVWVDFLEADVTPALEDSVIDGSHPIVANSLNFRNSIH